jgi:putative endonuclease
MLRLRMRSFWIYILASRPRGTLYVGITSDLVRRVQEHREGRIEGFTKQNSVKMLVYYEEYATAIEAIQREKNIKHWPRKWKIDLVGSMNPEWSDLWMLLFDDPKCSSLPGLTRQSIRRRRNTNRSELCPAAQYGPPGQARW